MVLGGALARALMWLYIAIPLVRQIPCYGSITIAKYLAYKIEPLNPNFNIE